MNSSMYKSHACSVCSQMYSLNSVLLSAQTSILIPPFCLTMYLALLDLVRLAMSSAARHLSSLFLNYSTSRGQSAESMAQESSCQGSRGAPCSWTSFMHEVHLILTPQPSSLTTSCLEHGHGLVFWRVDSVEGKFLWCV